MGTEPAQPAERASGRGVAEARRSADLVAFVALAARGAYLAVVLQAHMLVPGRQRQWRPQWQRRTAQQEDDCNGSGKEHDKQHRRRTLTGRRGSQISGNSKHAADGALAETRCSLRWHVSRCPATRTHARAAWTGGWAYVSRMRAHNCSEPSALPTSSSTSGSLAGLNAVKKRWRSPRSSPVR